MKVDTVIVGMGPAGLGTALGLRRTAPQEKVLLIDKGRPLTRRACPADLGKLCRGCGETCNVVSGFGGSMHVGDA